MINTDDYGNVHYYNENFEFHREDGPAIERTNGDKRWYQNGKLHRIDGPAIELASGDKEWYVNGQLHRLYGAAIEYSNGRKSYYLYGNVFQYDKYALAINSLSKSRNQSFRSF